MAADHIRGHDKVPHLALHREVVHQLQHEVFEDHTQAARADFALKRQLRDSVERVLGEAKTDILKLEKALVLLQERVLGFRENFHERALVQIAHDAGNGQAPHKFGDQAVADEVAGLHLFENLGIAALRRGGSGVGVKTQRMLANAAFDDLLQPDEGPTAYKQDIRRVHRGKFLVRVLAATLRRHVGNGAFENLEQGLLHALAADIAGDGGILVLLGDLVDFVDIDDALLGLLHIAIGGLQELQDDVLDVLTDVAGFGKGGGVHDGEWNVEHAGKGLRNERLARARGTDQDNIGLAEFHFTGLFVEENALVVVVNGHGEFFLGAILTNDVAIEELLDFGGPGQAARGSGGLFALLVFQNGLANAHTLIADVRARIVRRGTDQLLYLLLSLVAKGAAQGFVWAVFFHVCEGLVLRRKHRSIDSILGRILPRAKEKVSSTDSNQQRCAGLPVLVDDLINHAVFLGLLRIHDVIALDVLLDALDGLAGMLGKKLIDGGTHAQNLFGVQVDVGGLSAEAAHPGLMDEDAGVGQGEALFGRATGKEHGGDGCGLADTGGDHVRLDELHGVINGEAGGYGAARGIDVELNVFFRVFGLQEEHLGSGEVGDVVVNGRADKDDVFLEQAGIDIVGALAAAGLFDHHWNQSRGVIVGLFVFAHVNECARSSGDEIT